MSWIKTNFLVCLILIFFINLNICFPDNGDDCSSRFEKVELKLNDSTSRIGYVWLKAKSCPDEINRKTYVIYPSTYVLKIPNHQNTDLIVNNTKMTITRSLVKSIKIFPLKYSIENSCWILNVDSTEEFKVLENETPYSFYHLEGDVGWYCEIICFDKSIKGEKLKELIDKKGLRALGQAAAMHTDQSQKLSEKYRKIKDALFEKNKILVLDGFCFD